MAGAGERVAAMAFAWGPCGGRETYQGHGAKSRPVRSPTVAAAVGRFASPESKRFGSSSMFVRVGFATFVTTVSGFHREIARAVTPALPTEPTFPSKKWRDRRPKGDLWIFFLAHFWGGPKMFRLLQCACIAEQHWVSTEANT